MACDANNTCSCALAIFCEGTLVYENPLYRACFGTGFTPPPTTETCEPIFLTQPFPHVVAHTPLLRDEKEYSLFVALPFAEGDAREHILGRFQEMLTDIGTLFSRAKHRPPLRGVAVETLFRTVCLLAEQEFSLPFRPSGDTPEAGEYTRADLRGLLMALGILLPPMLARGSAHVHLQRCTDGWQMHWRGASPPAHFFLRHLAVRLCKSGGILLDFEENGFSFLFPAHRPKELSLYTPKPSRVGRCLHLGFYLGE